jgi:2-polyprenyl-6-methoxyphenol hydroxylase-like FAD-dependent oxidoreductase
VLWSRSLELIDRMGCTPAFLAAGFKAHGASIRSGTTLLGQARFDDVASPYNYALMIPQRDTEQLMTAHLAALGVTVERETRLTAFTAAADHVEARLLHTDVTEERIGTPWLVGCDGAHSTVRHGLGVEFIGQARVTTGSWAMFALREAARHRRTRSPSICTGTEFLRSFLFQADAPASSARSARRIRVIRGPTRRSTKFRR